MGELKSGLQKRQKYINMKNRWCEIPGVLGKQLMMNGGYFLYLAGRKHYGESESWRRFFEIDIALYICSRLRLLYLLSICYWKLYTVEDGVAAEVEQLKKGRQYYDKK